MDKSNNKLSTSAMYGALSVSLWLTSVSSGLWVFLIVFLPEGVFRNIGYGIAGIASTSFFLWFCKHAYKTEISMLKDNKTTADEG